MLRSKLVLILIAFPFFCWAQLVRVPIVHTAPAKKKNPSARTTSLPPMELPFWDDFSFNNSPYYANETLWENCNSVWVNLGVGINPPTLKVATFDGLDSLGRPYSVNDVSAKGYADKMTSRPLRMDLITGSQRDSAFIFFMYEYQGFAEAPDPGDKLSLWFKDNYKIWRNVWSITYNNLSNDSIFIPVKIPIVNPTDTSTYFFDNFQFQFRNFGRLSGPFDGWNLDYVYVSNGRKQYTPIYNDFPDRAISKPITSLFKQYRSIPAKHFLEDPMNQLTSPSVMVNNMRPDKIQTMTYSSRYRISSRVGKVTTTSDTITLNIEADTTLVYFNKPVAMNTTKLPDVSALDPKADSVAIKFEVNVNSGDNDIKRFEYDPFSGTYKPKGDYDTAVYKNLNFHHNDTTSSNFILRNYYAYDDGEAEYAASLTNPGNKVLYRFDLKYSQPDTLMAVDIYFTHTGDESSQVVKLLVMDSLRDDATLFYPPQDVVVARTERNKFTRVMLTPTTRPILVSDHFYIGWQQNTFGSIGVGLDYSSDSGNKVFVNFTGAWTPSEDIHANLMIRPVFGKSEVVTAIEDKKSIHVYPNPNRGNFYLDGNPSQIQITDMAGRAVSFAQENEFEKTRIQLSTTNPGLYVLRYFDGVNLLTEKIMVLP